jgi:hypothetical protein
MKVPNDLTALWLGGGFLVERKDPGDDHRRENEHVRASSYSAKHPAASAFFIRIVQRGRRARASLIFG